MSVRTKSIGMTAAMLCFGMSGAPARAADLYTVLAAIEQRFVCPEFLPDDTARRADMLAFSRDLASVGPKRLTYRQAAYIHAKMLERHNCKRRSTTMASAVPEVEDSAPAPVAPEVATAAN